MPNGNTMKRGNEAIEPPKEFHKRTVDGDNNFSVMDYPKRRNSVLLIATTWAIAFSLPLSFCSAWTVEPGSRNHRRWHPANSNSNRYSNSNSNRYNNNNVPNRRRRHTASSLFSTTAPAEPKTVYRDLFNASDAITNGTLRVDSIHTLYYEVHGTGPLNALFLHGGPGAGCFPNHARFFDPTKYTVVLLDQRGAGKSTPKGCVENNTLDRLVEDCEQLRKHLLPLNNNNNSSSGEMWDVVLGGSWGATLGLAYAKKHPLALKSLVLRGICALRPSEIDWLFSSKGGSSLKLPEAWKNFSEFVLGNKDRDEEDDGGRDALHAYYDCLFHTGANNGTADGNSVRLAAARSWMMWEMAATSSAASAGQQQQANTNNTDQSIPNVLVSSPACNDGMWHFENHLGEPVCNGESQSPEIVASQLRRGIEGNTQSTELPFVNEPRPVSPLKESMPLFDAIENAAAQTNNNKTSGFRLPPDYVPAQAMLTCYYSVNDLFVMGNKNLLETEIESVYNNVPPFKIIGIQGGKDPICPPDTALDLLRTMQMSTNNMELRIPLESGHSMYDPAIKHELVTATDRLAYEFLNQ